jgi:hypothetical protein
VCEKIVVDRTCRNARLPREISPRKQGRRSKQRPPYTA